MVLSLSGIKKSYQTAEGIIPVLNGVDLSLEAGESLALTGESGSGKSTLLHLAGGLDLPDSGIITVRGRKITDLDEAGRASFRRREVGLIFQQFNLIPSLDVGSNISFHARLAGRFDPVWEKAWSRRWGSESCLHAIPNSSPAVSSKGWRSDVRLRQDRPSFLPMSRQVISTRRRLISSSILC